MIAQWQAQGLTVEQMDEQCRQLVQEALDLHRRQQGQAPGQQYARPPGAPMQQGQAPMQQGQAPMQQGQAPMQQGQAMTVSVPTECASPVIRQYMGPDFDQLMLEIHQGLQRGIPSERARQSCVDLIARIQRGEAPGRYQDRVPECYRPEIVRAFGGKQALDASFDQIIEQINLYAPGVFTEEEVRRKLVNTCHSALNRQP